MTTQEVSDVRRLETASGGDRPGTLRICRLLDPRTGRRLGFVAADLEPENHAAPSGKYSLFVNPSDLYGRGKASYKLTLDGREVWSAEKPYTLWDACVADDGIVAGYAYTYGVEGFSGKGPDAGMGDLRVVILDPRGEERLDKVTKREFSRFLHTSPDPLAAGMILDAPHDRMVVRIRDADLNRGAESWWVYQLSTGKDLATFRPQELMADPGPVSFVVDAKPVMGTPLTLLHWWRYDAQKEQKQGARFTLIGQDGKSIWSLELPEDYETADDKKAEGRLRESLRRSGGILGSDRAGRFELRFVKASQRVTFHVARAADGAWAVSEVERRPFVETATLAPQPVEIPLLSPVIGL